MSRLWAALLHTLRYEPATMLYGLATGIDILISFGFVHLTTGQRGAVLTIATGLLTVVQMFFVREWSVPVIVGAVTTGLTACAAFGFHLSDHTLGTIASVLTIGLGLLLRQAVTPAAAPARM